MKKILLSIGSILFAGALLVGGTGAFLADNNSSTGNTFATGVIQLLVDNESYATDNWGKLYFSTSTSWLLSNLEGKLFFNFLDIKPGDIGEDTISLHVNNNNAWACMNVNLTATPENGQNEPELAVDPTIGTNDGELQNNLFFTFWADDGDNVFEIGEKVFKEGLVKDIFNGQNWAIADAQTNIWDVPGPLVGGTTKYIGKAWCFGTVAKTPLTQDNLGKTGANGPLVRGTGFSCSGVNVGNIVQSDGIKADVSFSVAQSRSNSGYLCAGGEYVPPPTSTPTLFSDDFGGSWCQKGKEFNSINNGNWSQYGGVAGDNHGNPHGNVADFDAGTNPGSPNHTEWLMTKSISTVGFHNITLKYDRNMDVPLGTTATLTVEYSVNGGTSWATLETVTVDHPWITKMWSLSPFADNKASVKVRFTLVGTNSSDHAYIDNVILTGVSP